MHGSLVWVRNFKEPEGQLARWLERLEEYDFTVIQRRGSQHSNADALSRGPCKQYGRSSHFHNGAAEVAVTGAVTDMHFQTCSTEEMRHLQSQDPIIGPVYNTVRDGRQPSPNELSVLGRESKWLLQQWDCLAFQLISLHDEVLKDLHEGAVGGHLGEGKMLEKLKERFIGQGAVRQWENGAKDVLDAEIVCPKTKSKSPYP